MIPLLNGNGEISLISDNPKCTSLDSSEQWQVDNLVGGVDDSSSYSSNAALSSVDQVVADWLKLLTPEQWAKIRRQNSLFGIPVPQDWIKVWRFILKEPTLRDSQKATRGGRSIGSYGHLWNMWSEQCIEKYTDEIDRELLALVDAGWVYAEIGERLLGKYGDEFWKPRKQDTKTTPSQVVNNYLYMKIPTKIARRELYDICRKRLARNGLI